MAFNQQGERLNRRVLSYTSYHDNIFTIKGYCASEERTQIIDFSKTLDTKDQSTNLELNFVKFWAIHLAILLLLMCSGFR